MKYLLVLLVVGVVLWMLLARSRTDRRGERSDTGGSSSRSASRATPPQAMLACAHCGLHLPAGDAVLDGSRIYCSEAHRALGPRAEPPR